MMEEQMAMFMVQIPISVFTSPNFAMANSKSSFVWAAEICVRMRALPFGTTGKESNDVNAFVEHRVGELAGQRGIAEHDGRDGMRAFENVETTAGHLVAEKFCVGLKAVAQLGGGVEQVDVP